MRAPDAAFADPRLAVLYDPLAARVALDGEVLESTSTLRFRALHEMTADLRTAGFEVVDVRDAPDRPGLEHVVVARRT